MRPHGRLAGGGGGGGGSRPAEELGDAALAERLGADDRTVAEKRVAGRLANALTKEKRLAKRAKDVAAAVAKVEAAAVAVAVRETAVEGRAREVAGRESAADFTRRAADLRLLEERGLAAEAEAERLVGAAREAEQGAVERKLVST